MAHKKASVTLLLRIVPDDGLRQRGPQAFLAACQNKEIKEILKSTVKPISEPRALVFCGNCIFHRAVIAS